MSVDPRDRLYNRLPAIYRIRDYEQGQPLRALMGIMEREAQAVELDIERLYNNWFIETCEEWVVPYIADLLAIPPLHTGGVGSFSLRAYVANALRYRRRKGAASILEEVAQDVTGWPARSVEFYRRLVANQHTNHPRASSAATVSLKDANALELFNTPFEGVTRTIDVRRIESGRGLYNIPNIGIFLWRLQAYFVRQVRPGRLDEEWYLTFDPLGVDRPLFNRPLEEKSATTLAGELNVPGRLRRRPLFDELNERRRALRGGETHRGRYFGEQDVVEVYSEGTKLEPEEIMVCNLMDMRKNATEDPSIRVLVDPVLGRLLPVNGTAAETLEVGYAYGFSGDVGAGPYNRRESLQGTFGDAEELWFAGVSKALAMSDDPDERLYATLSEAIKHWNTERPRAGVIAILDSDTYAEDLTGEHKITIPAGHNLMIVAGAWRAGTTPAPEDWDRAVVKELDRFVVANERRPCILGDISIRGEEPADSEEGISRGRLVLNGLLMQGNLTVLVGDLGELALRHCTVVPKAQVKVSSSTAAKGGGRNTQALVHLHRCITGPISTPEFSRGLQVSHSVVDASTACPDDGYAITGIEDGGVGGPLTIEKSTVLGRVNVRTLERASECIFYAHVQAKILQTGCVRYSYLPHSSQVPKRFRCQPDLMLDEYKRDLGLDTGEDLPPEKREFIRVIAVPEFTSIDYGDPGYAQLSLRTEEGIRTGAEDGSEMGVFNDLKQPQREANLRASLKEYLRFGMDAGFFFVD